MKDVITVNNMRISDAHTIETKIPSKKLMYDAAMGVYNSYKWHDRIGIYCGSGNNAGDGYALALILNENKYNVTIVLCGDRFSNDGRYYYDLCIENNIEIINFNPNLYFDIAVDCLFGTGFNGEVNEKYKIVIENINKNKEVISVDINSGLNGDNGMTNCSVKSDLTVSIGYLKPGMFLNQAKDYIKRLVNIDIGIQAIEKPFKLFEKEDLKYVITKRMNFSHKGTYGYIGIMGGSDSYPGAIRLANMSQLALYSGCGVSRLVVPDSIYDLLFSNVIESTIKSIKSVSGKMIFNKNDIDEALHNLDVLGIGVGWDSSDEYIKILEYILLNYNLLIVIDADGLNTLSKMDLNILNNSKSKIVLTPHLKEFSRLTNVSISEILENPIGISKDFVNKYNVTLLLKGPSTIVVDNNDLFIVNSGSPGMATAGSGDVLTGLICGMLGYNSSNMLLTVTAAAYINGYAGELAEQEFGTVSMVASDTINMIRKIIKEIEKYDS